MSNDPETFNTGTEFRAHRAAEREWEKTKADRELRRWCIEQVALRQDIITTGLIAEADKIYDWVRNKPKADAA